MYVFSYFLTESEALHLALSDDGLSWTPLNGNRATLAPTVGAQGMRDPFIVRDEHEVFHLLGTDGWQSPFIIHASSTDLVAWSEQVLVPAMTSVPGARNAWAPECFRDREHGCYRIIWSSTVSTDAPEGHRDHRIWSMATDDFRTFSAPDIFFDPGYNVIDATVAHDGDGYIMPFKDERGVNKPGTDFKAIRIAHSGSATGPFTDISPPVTPALVEGPSLIHRDTGWLLLYDHFTEHRYGASTSPEGRNWRTCNDIVFPPGARHGSVLEIPDSTAERLVDTYGTGGT